MAGNRPKNNQWLPTLLVAICIFIFLAYAFRSCQKAAHNTAPPFKRSVSGSYTNKKATVCLQPSDSMVLPAIMPDDHIISHLGYTLSFDDKDRIAYWVAYTLTAEKLENPVAGRSENFRPDGDLENSATLEDYRRSGYDRGHLAPAYDMRWSAQAMSESFLLSNITPQNHGFNEHIWAELENAVRVWAKQDKELYVVTGPVLTDDMETIGRDKVAVPEYFYKVVLDANLSNPKSVGFIIPNRDLKESFWKYAVPMDSVEHVTGLHFFARLPEAVRNAVEHTFSARDWRTHNAFVQ